MTNDKIQIGDTVRSFIQLSRATCAARKRTTWRAW